MNLERIAVLLTTALVASNVGCRPRITNPSGSCGTRDDAGRAGYHVPADDDVWVPDCQNTLAREYWRVYSQDGLTGYVIPRPDGAPEFSTPCADPQHELHLLVVRYGLCSAAGSPEQANIINHIDLPDALHLTHFLHGQLKFVAAQDGSGIEPFPIPGDIVDACALGGAMNSSDLEAICQRERDRLQSGIDIGFSYTGPGAAELVMRLNQLYGIAP